MFARNDKILSILINSNSKSDLIDFSQNTYEKVDTKPHFWHESWVKSSFTFLLKNWIAIAYNNVFDDFF